MRRGWRACRLRNRDHRFEYGRRLLEPELRLMLGLELGGSCTGTAPPGSWTGGATGRGSVSGGVVVTPSTSGQSVESASATTLNRPTIHTSGLPSNGVLKTSKCRP